MKTFLTTLLLLVATSVFSQNEITGRIIDAQSQEPIVFANIYFSKLEKGATTDFEGNFKISKIPDGTYTVVVSYMGYETLSKTLTFPLTASLELSLFPSAIEMEQIIVSTPFHKLQSENVMKVERATISNLKAKGALTLSEGISSIAGVESITTGVGIGKPVIRGLSSNRVLVYAQDVRLENQQFGDEHGLGLSDSGIESVEVIKGPASLLYGSDALGGVLYLNPEKFAPLNSKKSDANINYNSNTQGFQTGIGHKSSGDHFKFLFRGSHSEHSDYKTKSYRVTNTRFKEQDFKAGIAYQGDHFKTEMRYNMNNSNLGIPEEIGEQTTIRTPELPNQQIFNHILSSKSTVFFEKSSLDINVGLLYNDRKEFEDHHHGHDEHDHDAEDPALHMKLKTLNYDVKYHLPTLGKFETIVGVQGMNQTNTNYGEETLIPNANTNDIGILATSHIHFEKADIQIGARFDNRRIDVTSGLQKDFNSFNGAAGIKINLAKNITSRLNFASGFRAPNLAELTSDGSHEGTNRYEIGNENLKQEQNYQVDLTLEYKSEHLEIFGNGFYNTMKNYIFLSPDGTLINDTPVYNYLQADANLYGGEFGLHLHPHPLDWLHFESSFEIVMGKQENSEYLPLIPANTIHNMVRAEFNTAKIHKGNAFVKLSSTLKQSNISSFETSTDGYQLLSAGFGGSFLFNTHELRFTVSGNNLTNKEYIHHLSRLKPEGIYNIGRNFSIGLSYSL